MTAGKSSTSVNVILSAQPTRDRRMMRRPWTGALGGPCDLLASFTFNSASSDRVFSTAVFAASKNTSWAVSATDFTGAGRLRAAAWLEQQKHAFSAQRSPRARTSRSRSPFAAAPLRLAPSMLRLSWPWSTAGTSAVQLVLPPPSLARPCAVPRPAVQLPSPLPSAPDASSVWTGPGTDSSSAPGVHTARPCLSDRAPAPAPTAAPVAGIPEHYHPRWRLLQLPELRRVNPPRTALASRCRSLTSRHSLCSHVCRV